jgi:hypothetical protein
MSWMLRPAARLGARLAMRETSGEMVFFFSTHKRYLAQSTAITPLLAIEGSKGR